MRFILGILEVLGKFLEVLDRFLEVLGRFLEVLGRGGGSKVYGEG